MPSLSEALRFRFRRLRISSSDLASSPSSFILFPDEFLRTVAASLYGAFPSQYLHSTPLLASALSANLFHTAPFPFTEGEVRTSCTVVIRAVWTSPISLVSGWLAIMTSQCLSNDARISVRGWPLVKHAGLRFMLKSSRNYFKTDSQSVSMSCYRAHSGTCDQILLPVWILLLFMFGVPLDGRADSQFAMQSLNDPSRAEPVTILYCLMWESSNLKKQVPVFISPKNKVAQLYPRSWSSENTWDQTVSKGDDRHFYSKNCDRLCTDVKLWCKLRWIFTPQI
jgi:hypothetical protein